MHRWLLGSVSNQVIQQLTDLETGEVGHRPNAHFNPNGMAASCGCQQVHPNARGK
jgi:hypothetical protein